MAHQQNSDGLSIPQPNIGFPPSRLIGGQRIISPQLLNGGQGIPPLHQQINGAPPVQAMHTVQYPGSFSQPSTGSSYSVLSNQTASSANNGFVNVFGNGTAGQGMSLTDISLEQAMEKVQELATENATLREYLKENNENMKKQFQMLLQWKEKVRESNKQNLHRFEQLRGQISVLKAENDKYKQCLQGPDKQSSVLEELQKNVRRLETEKMSSQHQIEALRDKMDEMKVQLNKSPSEETVYVNTVSDEGENEAVRRHCADLSQQMYNLRQQNEQLMADLQQVNTLKIDIQVENCKLHEDNLDLQKKLQGFLGDMNKTKYSLGALQDPNNKQYEYGGVRTSVEKETESSVTSRADIELLALQAAATERQLSHNETGRPEVVTSEREEELRGKLQQEKERCSQKTQQLSSQEAQILRLQSQLSEKDQMLGHYKEQLDSQIAQMTQEHRKQTENLLRQLDNINSELKHTKSSMPYTEDVQNLKSQVMSLIQESQELSRKLEMATKNMDRKSARIMELEEQLRNSDQSRQEMNNYIHTMKINLTVSEDTINKERAEHATTKKQLMEFRGSFNRLVNDYKELLDTFDEYKASQLSQHTGNQSKQQMEEINRLTAQTIAAEEAITFRDDQIKQLKTEIAKLKDEVDNTIPVLRAQAEVWKQDFDAERYARERQVEEKDSILHEMKNLELKNQQLIDELESYSRKSLAEMQRRHAGPSYQQQLQNHLQVGSPGGHYQHIPNTPPHQPQQNISPRAGYQSHSGYPLQQPVEHASGDDGHAIPVNPPQTGPQSQGSSGQEEGEGQNMCPKCGVCCPDMDTLQIHVIDCLDN